MCRLDEVLTWITGSTLGKSFPQPIIIPCTVSCWHFVVTKHKGERKTSVVSKTDETFLKLFRQKLFLCKTELSNFLTVVLRDSDKRSQNKRPLN